MLRRRRRPRVRSPTPSGGSDPPTGCSSPRTNNEAGRRTVQRDETRVSVGCRRDNCLSVLTRRPCRSERLAVHTTMARSPADRNRPVAKCANICGNEGRGSARHRLVRARCLRHASQLQPDVHGRGFIDRGGGDADRCALPNERARNRSRTAGRLSCAVRRYGHCTRHPRSTGPAGRRRGLACRHVQTRRGLHGTRRVGARSDGPRRRRRDTGRRRAWVRRAVAALVRR